MSIIKIENIVAFAQVSDLLDIKLLNEKIPNSSYNPNEFEGISIKYENPKAATLILSTGKVVCTGAKTVEDVEKTIKKTIKKIKEVGFDIKKGYKIQIENLIASTDFKKEMHLSSIASGLIMQNMEYHPEEFPGLIYRMDDQCTELILFSSGKLVCTGAKSLEDATSAIKMMEEKLSSIGVL
jgi:transcription initiation factor TFIID TATA-box-binding protein